jgi:NAD(P)-dependent dehydrogenase (short-subunit alcohol dehydrogenase family)
MTVQTWLITGCSTGFGRALAEVLLESGERVVATARRPETLDPLVAAHGERVLPLKLDVTRPDEIAAVVAAARKRFAAIDALVNNAGYGYLGTVEEAPIEDARAMMETNYFGTLGMIRAVLPEMIARRAGRIVNIGSVAGQIGFPTLAYYSASKFALAGLSESLGAELALLGIHVTLAELGPYATEFTGSMTFLPPAPHYDMAALTKVAGNAAWSAGDDPRSGAIALLSALHDPTPPRRLILGREGFETIELHDGYRSAERARWLHLVKAEPAPAG